MQLKFDLNAGTLYISLSDHEVSRTREVDDNTNVGVDAAGEVVGIEVISTQHPWPLSRILADYSLPAGEEAHLRAYFYLPAPAAAQAVMPQPAMPPPPQVGIA